MTDTTRTPDAAPATAAARTGLLAKLETMTPVLVLAVAGLQSVLGVTGYCLGCRLYFLRWWVPDRFARVIGRGVQREKLLIVEPDRRR